MDVITTGNHIWDNLEIIPYINSCEKLLRPINFPKLSPGKGFCVYELNSGFKILVINVMGQIMIEPIGLPFEAVDKVLDIYAIRKNIDAIIIDIHAEASSEKQAFGHYYDGKVSAVIGSHTHVPTSDGRILQGGTAFITDAGMCGDYNSIIGMRKDEPIFKMVKKMRPNKKMEPSDGDGAVAGLLMDIDEKTGLSKRVDQIIIGANIKNIIPE